MISVPLLIVLICNFITIGLLPLLFLHRDRKCGFFCFALGAPFLISLTSILCGFFGFIEYPPQAYGSQYLLAQSCAAVLSVASIALIALTVGTHRLSSATGRQKYGAFVEVVTWGPYSRVRHPLYTSCLLAIMAAVLAWPHPLTLGCLFYSFIALSVSAAREERRLAASEIGHEYRRYLAHSGRFFPRLMP